jgi:hypothetical protein
MTKTKYKKLIDEFAENCPLKNGYCSLKELLMHMHKDPRLLIQIKCVEKLKYEESQKQGKDVGWTDAFLLWVKSGMAKKFAAIYDEEKSIDEIYAKLRRK